MHIFQKYDYIFFTHIHCEYVNACMNKEQLMYPWVILIGNYLWNLLSKYWIFVCTGMMLLISIQEVVVYRIVYLILFLLFMLTFQVNLLTSPVITGKIMIFFELSNFNILLWKEYYAFSFRGSEKAERKISRMQFIFRVWRHWVLWFNFNFFFLQKS